MIRRGFIGSLAAAALAPFAPISKMLASRGVSPPEPQKLLVKKCTGVPWPEYLRNTGRTQHAILTAVSKLETHSDVVLLVHSLSEVDRAYEIAYQIAGRAFADPVSIPHVRMLICDRSGKGKRLHVRSVDVKGYRGLRAFFVIDHSVWDKLSPDEFTELCWTLKECSGELPELV